MGYRLYKTYMPLYNIAGYQIPFRTPFIEKTLNSNPMLMSISRKSHKERSSYCHTWLQWVHTKYSFYEPSVQVVGHVEGAKLTMPVVEVRCWDWKNTTSCSPHVGQALSLT